MKRRVFYSFHYELDYWRTQQVRNIGMIEGNTVTTPNNWESLKLQGEQAVKSWIDSNLIGKSCLIVLVGSSTANRKWINYEICEAWNRGMGVFGIKVNTLKDRWSNQSAFGNNPFEFMTIDSMCKSFRQNLSEVAKLYAPFNLDSKAWYNFIVANKTNWIETAITQRNYWK